MSAVTRENKIGMSILELVYRSSFDSKQDEAEYIEMAYTCIKEGKKQRK